MEIYVIKMNDYMNYTGGPVSVAYYEDEKDAYIACEHLNRCAGYCEEYDVYEEELRLNNKIICSLCKKDTHLMHSVSDTGICNDCYENGTTCMDGKEDEEKYYG